MTEEKARKIVQRILLLILGVSLPFLVYFLWELILVIILGILVILGLYALMLGFAWVVGLPWKEIKDAHHL